MEGQGLGGGVAGRQRPSGGHIAGLSSSPSGPLLKGSRRAPVFSPGAGCKPCRAAAADQASGLRASRASRLWLPTRFALKSLTAGLRRGGRGGDPEQTQRRAHDKGAPSGNSRGRRHPDRHTRPTCEAAVVLGLRRRQLRASNCS